MVRLRSQLNNVPNWHSGRRQGSLGVTVDWRVAGLMFSNQLITHLMLTWNCWSRADRVARTLKLNLLPLHADMSGANRHLSQVTGYSPTYANSNQYKYQFSKNWSNPVGTRRSLHPVGSMAPRHELFKRWGGWRRRTITTTFHTFLRAGASVPQSIIETHRSFRSIYLGRSGGWGTAFHSIAQLRGVWVLFYSLLYHLTYHNIQSLMFAPPSFHREVLALNWEMATNLKGMWRFVRPFMTLRASQFLDKTDYVFTRIRMSGVSLAIVSDIQYHKRTLHHLKSNGYFTLGLVPISSSRYLVDCALPISNQGSVAQLFFLRFIIRMRREALTRRYSYLLNY
jgi:hypothetical protein